MRYQGSVIADKAQEYGDIVAICDVDRDIAEKAKQQFGGKADLYEDYRALLERKDIDAVTIGSPDHWHTAMVIDACRAVGVPARFVGTPLWADKSGNHSWVEVWDKGWHFTGAAEPAGDR